MDELIKAVFEALENGSSIDAIHKAIIAKGWSGEDAFLAIKAGQNLYDGLEEQKKELAKRPLPFGRKP
jgi:hypothetical protein